MHVRYSCESEAFVKIPLEISVVLGFGSVFVYDLLNSEARISSSLEMVELKLKEVMMQTFNP